MTHPFYHFILDPFSILVFLSLYFTCILNLNTKQNTLLYYKLRSLRVFMCILYIYAICICNFQFTIYIYIYGNVFSGCKWSIAFTEFFTLKITMLCVTSFKTMQIIYILLRSFCFSFFIHIENGIASSIVCNIKTFHRITVFSQIKYSFESTHWELFHESLDYVSFFILSARFFVSFQFKNKLELLKCEKEIF